MKILITIGTRPNMIKVTQFKRLARQYDGLEVKLAHTGQHYDHKMAEVFFEQFEMKPDHRLVLAQREPVPQMGEMMIKLAELFKVEKPDLVLVPGDVNSTFASAFAAHRSGIDVGHIESGLRSFDRTMPEEINRLLTDEISDLFFVTEPSGRKNLLNEGKRPVQIHYVGNTMIDTLVHFDPQIDAAATCEKLKLSSRDYVLMTFHRPSNVDNVDGLNKLVELITEITKDRICVFPVHPRTQKMLDSTGMMSQLRDLKALKLLDPLGYFEFQNLIKNALVIITDSGGIQEESTYRQVPCITLRPNTERPVTIEEGSNVLMDFDTGEILRQLACIQSGSFKEGQIPELWDGKATQRILDALLT